MESFSADSPDGSVLGSQLADQARVAKQEVNKWSVYMVECLDGSLYTGISNNVERRFEHHVAGKGAKYFRLKRPLRVVYQEDGYDRRTASQRELVIKQMSRTEKLLLILANAQE